YLAQEARRLVDQADHAFEATRRVARGEAAQLRVGVPPSVMLTDLPNMVRKYRDRWPQVNFGLRELSTSAIKAALAAREIDLGFLREVRPGGPLEARVFLTESVVAVLPVSHPLATAKGPLKLRALKAKRFVFFPKRLGATFYDALIQACVDAGFTPNIVQEATQWSTVVSLVEAGMGVSLAPACVAKMMRRGVVYREVRGLETSVYVGWRQGEL
ncbi:MAG: LysR family substrate-binding domain-containing protein, partial [Acidobacteriota bacterium]